MKQERKNSRKWLWLIIAIVAVLAVVGVVLGIVLAGGGEGADTDTDKGPKGGRADLYWNIDRALYTNATTGMSGREKGADGKYHITLAYEGEQLEFAIADKRLVNYIDTTDAVSLIFDDEGNVIDAADPTTVAKEIAKNFYVVKVEGDTITLNGTATLEGLTKQITCGELAKVYNLSCERERKG